MELTYNSIGRRYCTRHRQHISMQGKRLLVRMTVGGLLLSGFACTRRDAFTTSTPSDYPTVAVLPTILLMPDATYGDLSFTPRRSSGHQLVMYAEVIRVPSTPGNPGQPAPSQHS
ncbi:hypothetical protein J6590_101422 [Homalodisca vitripennis]|nr:hypothetical protein J6590_101422 [Homalodisca vitripennis]